MAVTYAKKASIGFPAAGSVLIRGTNNAASAARGHLQYLLLDILKKGREQSRKAGLPATLGKRKRGIQAPEMEESDNEDGSDEAKDDADHEDDDDDAEWPRKRRDITGNLIPKIVVWVYIVDVQYTDDAIDRSQPNAYTWATCHKSQLVILEEASMEVVYAAIKSRIGAGRTIRAMYGAITKPHPSGVTPADVVRLTNDDDLEAFLEVARTEYKPLCIQVQLARDDGTAQTPPPDDQPYFPADCFVGPDPATLYDVPVLDSENARYLRAMGKGKKKAWPKSDAGFEHQKAMTKKRICRLKRHLEALKEKHKEFYGEKYDTQVIDSEDDGEPSVYFQYNAWLNPQSGAEWVESRNAVITGVVHGNTLPDAGKRKAIRRKILETWGKPRVSTQEGQYNEFHLGWSYRY